MCVRGGGGGGGGAEWGAQILLGSVELSCS